MSVLYLSWRLTEVEKETIKRYCPSCERIATFSDSLKRRHNANGKQVHCYAIYKCEKDHTWNRNMRKETVDMLPKATDSSNTVQEEHQELLYEELVLANVTKMHIHILSVVQKQRLDNVLSSRIKDISRSRIQKWIREGIIQVNHLRVTPSYFICPKDIVIILINKPLEEPTKKLIQNQLPKEKCLMSHHLIFQSDYSNDTTKRERLYELFEKVFGIPTHTFRDFYNRGFWDPNYRPFTYVDGSRAVANVAHFPLDILLQGKPRKVAGIQSVMTDPDYRRSGLMTELMHRMLQEMDQEFDISLLFTHSPEIYIRFGYRVLKEHYFVVPFSHPGTGRSKQMRNLNPFTATKDLQRIQHAFRHRAPLSKELMPLSYQDIFFLNMYDPSHAEKMYFVEELNAIVVYEVKEKTLKLYDVLSEHLPSIEEICACIPAEFEKIEIYFCPDQFADHSLSPVELKNQDVLMVRGPFPLEDTPFCFPVMGHF